MRLLMQVIPSWRAVQVRLHAGGTANLPHPESVAYTQRCPACTATPSTVVFAQPSCVLLARFDESVCSAGAASASPLAALPLLVSFVVEHVLGNNRDLAAQFSEQFVPLCAADIGAVGQHVDATSMRGWLLVRIRKAHAGLHARSASPGRASW